MSSIVDQDAKQFRAKYIEHHKMVSAIDGYELIDVYFLLLVLYSRRNGVDEIYIPCFWFNQIGGCSAMTVDRVESLSDLLEVKECPNNSAAKIVTGLTHKGLLLLKSHVTELSTALPLFALTEDDLVNIDEA